MPRRASEGRSSDLTRTQSLRSVDSEEDDEDYSEGTSTDSTLEDDEEGFRGKEGSGSFSQMSLPMSIFSSYRIGAKSRLKSVQMASRSVVSIGEELVEGIVSRARQAFRDVLIRVLGAVSQFVNRVARVFLSPDDAKRDSMRDSKRYSRRDSKRESKRYSKRYSKRETKSSHHSSPRKETDTDVAEIRTYQDIICWKSDNHTAVFKRNPDQYTVFEIKQAGQPDELQEQKQDKKPRIPKEMTPLGTTVYRQPARAICIGTEQISGLVRVVLDYTQKVAFVQIISAKSEVYATYDVDSITFLNTCTPLGVAWVGDMFPPDKIEPDSGTGTKQSLELELEKNPQRPSKTPSSGSSADREEKLKVLREWIRSSRDFARYSTNKTSNMPVEDSTVRNSQSDSNELLPGPSSKTLRLLHTDSKELKSALGEKTTVSEGDTTLTMKNSKKASGEGIGSGNSKSKEKIISIDVVNVVFNNPDQAQRLINIVETLKSALRQSLPPRLAMFYDSTYSCGASTVRSSTTGEQLSNPSSDQESVVSLPPGYFNLASKLYNLRGIQSISQEAKEQSEGDTQLNFDSTKSPMRGCYEDNDGLDKSLQENEAVKILDKNIDPLEEKQTDVKRGMSNEILRSDPNSQELYKGKEEPFQSRSLQPYHDQASRGGLPENNYNLRNRSYAGLHQQTDVARNPYSLQGQPGFTRQNTLAGAAPFPIISNQQEYTTQDPWQSLFYSNLNFPAAAGSPMAYTYGNQTTSVSRNQIYSNQMPSYCESQMLSTSRNQIPLFSTIMPTSFGNQMLINSGNQRPPAYGIQMPSPSGNQRHLALANQMFLDMGNQMPFSSSNELLPVVSNSTSRPSQNTRCRVYRSINPSSIRRQWSITNPKPCNKVRVCHITEADDS